MSEKLKYLLGHSEGFVVALLIEGIVPDERRFFGEFVFDALDNYSIPRVSEYVMSYNELLGTGAVSSFIYSVIPRPDHQSNFLAARPLASLRRMAALFNLLPGELPAVPVVTLIGTQTEETVDLNSQLTSDGGRVEIMCHPPYTEPVPASALKEIHSMLQHEQVKDFLHCTGDEDWNQFVLSVLVHLGNSKNIANITSSYTEMGVALEKLFMKGLGSKSEIAETVAMNAARLLGIDTDDRIFIYRTTKQIYNKRSVAVHGKVITLKNAQDFSIYRGHVDFLIRACKYALIRKLPKTEEEWLHVKLG